MRLSKVLEKENNNLDIIRLIAAMMVIYGHSYALLPQYGQRDVVAKIIGFDYSGSLAVKIFFFLSGLVVSNSLLKNKNISSFIFSRVFRILPGLMFVITASTFLIGPWLSVDSIQSYFSNSHTYNYFFKNIILQPQWILPGVFNENAHNAFNGSLWTLPYEVVAYAFTLIVFIIIGFNNKKLASLICLLVIVEPLLGNKIIFTWIKSGNTEISMLAPCFAFGILLSIWKEQITVNKTLIASLWVLYYILYQSDYSMFVFYASFFMTLLYVSTTPFFLKIRFPADISYGVYLWGWPVQQIFAQFIPNSGILLNQLLSVAVSLILGAVSWFWVEKRFISSGKKAAVRFSQIKFN